MVLDESLQPTFVNEQKIKILGFETHKDSDAVTKLCYYIVKATIDIM